MIISCVGMQNRQMKIFGPALMEGRWYTGRKIRQITPNLGRMGCVCTAVLAAGITRKAETKIFILMILHSHRKQNLHDF